MMEPDGYDRFRHMDSIGVELLSRDSKNHAYSIPLETMAGLATCDGLRNDSMSRKVVTPSRDRSQNCRC